MFSQMTNNSFIYTILAEDKYGSKSLMYILLL